MRGSSWMRASGIASHFLFRMAQSLFILYDDLLVCRIYSGLHYKLPQQIYVLYDLSCFTNIFWVNNWSPNGTCYTLRQTLHSVCPVFLLDPFRQPLSGLINNFPKTIFACAMANQHALFLKGSHKPLNLSFC